MWSPDRTDRRRLGSILRKSSCDPNLRPLPGPLPATESQFEPLLLSHSIAYISSHWLTSAHIGSHQLTLAHIGSHQLTLAHIGSHWLTLAHIGSHWLTFTNVALPPFAPALRLPPPFAQCWATGFLSFCRQGNGTGSSDNWTPAGPLNEKTAR